MKQNQQHAQRALIKQPNRICEFSIAEVWLQKSEQSYQKPVEGGPSMLVVDQL